MAICMYLSSDKMEGHLMMHEVKRVLCRCFCKNGRLWSCVAFCTGLSCTKTVVAYFVANKSIIQLKDVNW